MTENNTKEYRPGENVSASNIEFVVLDKIRVAEDIDEDFYFVMTLYSQFISLFETESRNNYAKSDLRNRINTWLDKTGIDKSRIMPRHLDLITLDGYKGFGIHDVLAAPLTLDEWRKYADIIPSPDNNEWLATALSETNNSWVDKVFFVHMNGNLDYGYAYKTCGVRPAMILPSITFDS